MKMQIFDLQFDDYDEISANGTTNGTTDVAFRKVNKNSTAFLIWKVENMSLLALPRDQYGTFYDTDSYIVYAATHYGQPCGVDTVTREVKGGLLEYHIHFWLGSRTNPDKSGVAAYKTVELDNFLGCCTTQHRETEGNESPRFLSFFKNGLRIIKPELIQNGQCFQARLYRVKGKRIPVLTEMSKVSWDFFNSSDVFIIHTRKNIFVWIGRAANAIKKLHATKIATDLKEEYKVNNIIFLDDGYEKTLPEEMKKEFNKYLPLEKRIILPENQDEDENGNYKRSSIKLYKCSENNGKYRVAEVGAGPFQQSDLNPDDVFIVDHELNGIWVWVGKRANDKERSEALRNARGFVKKKKYPSNTKVTRVVDGYEPLEFKTLFSSWKDDVKGPKPSILVSKYDAVTMEERPTLAAETQLIDDGTGSLTIWRIKQSHIVEIPKERHGYFFSGDCYIILYTYHTSSEQKHLLYCWLGLHASQEEINSTTQKLNEIDEELGQLGFQARIIQGRETAHFLQLFKGKFIVFKGRGLEFDESGKNMKNPSQYLVQVFGSTTYSSKAFQVSLKASSLNSNYCFVLKRGKKSYIWSGNYSTGDQREMAKGFAGKDFELVLEGKEREDFFTLLGGKSHYSTQMLKNDSDPKSPRLFHCTTINGIFHAEEIIFFTQKDLLPEHVMMLDTNDSIYIWMGKLSTRDEQRLSFQTAIEYLQTDPAGRDMNIAIIHVKQDKEPPTFRGFFPSWDKKCWKLYKTFGKIRQEIEMKNTNVASKENNGINHHDISGHSDFDQYDKYPVNILKEPNDKLPARINPLNKESPTTEREALKMPSIMNSETFATQHRPWQNNPEEPLDSSDAGRENLRTTDTTQKLHLTHDDFVSLFKMPYLEFEKLPRWKQQEMKKKVGLF